MQLRHAGSDQPPAHRRDQVGGELADAVGVTVVNLSVLKNNRARAVRFSTITAICEVLDCQVGDVLSVEREVR